jgi:hypothetical protein
MSPRTPDRTPGPSLEEELQLEDNAIDPSVVGSITQNAGALKGRDSIGVFDLRSGAGLSEAAHRTLDQLPHGIAEDSHTQVTRVGGKVTNVTVWTDSGETVKIRETAITRVSGKVSQMVTTQYDGAGAAITGEVYTQTVNRVTGRVDSVDGVLT